VFQFHEAGMAEMSSSEWTGAVEVLDFLIPPRHDLRALNSTVFKSAYSLRPTVEVWVGSAFQLTMKR